MRRTADPPPEYGLWLRFYREQAGLTQRALAETAGVGYVSINHLENDRRWASDDMAKALARALGVKPDDLFPANGTPSPNATIRAYLQAKKRRAKKS